MRQFWVGAWRGYGLRNATIIFTFPIFLRLIPFLVLVLAPESIIQLIRLYISVENIRSL